MERQFLPFYCEHGKRFSSTSSWEKEVRAVKGVHSEYVTLYTYFNDDYQDICFPEDIFKVAAIKTGAHCKLTDAERAPTAWVAALCLYGNSNN